MLIYKSKEKWFNIMMSGSLLGMVAFNVNSYYEQRYSLGIDSKDVITPLYMAGGLAIVFALTQYRIYNSPIKILLKKDGQTLLVEKFGFMGLYSRFTQLDVNHMTGFHSFLHRKSKKTTKRSGFMFFKREFIVDQEIFRPAMEGKQFNVTTEMKNIKISQKKKQAYNL